MKWTLENIPDLSGKTIVVTGGNSGLGFESVKAFANKGADVILACRSIEKGEEAKRLILEYTQNGSVSVKKLDLADLASVKSFADVIILENLKLDILLNNAGIMIPPYSLTKDGFESQFGTNHLGHFALTAHLYPLIKSTPNSRIVSLSSMAHNGGVMNFGNLNYDDGKSYKAMTAYKRSKMANLYFIYELQRRLSVSNKNTIAVAAHPGVSQTNLAHFVEDKFIFKILNPLLNLVTQSAAMGALPQIRACVDKNLKGAEYYGPDGRAGFKGFPVVVKSSKPSHDTAIAKQLWDWSEELTGVTFTV